MKKFIFLLIVTTILAFGVNSCQKDKDGIYNPKDKISKVHAEGKWYEDGELYLNISKQVYQTWNWKKNKLESIVMQNGTLTYTYQGKQVSKISAGVASMNFHYDGADLTEIELQNISYSMWIKVLERDADRHITKLRYEVPTIEIKSFEEYKTNFSEIKDLINLGFSNQMADILDKNLERQYKTHQTKGTSNVDFTFIYTGDNVTKITVNQDGTTENYHYTYDNKTNPYYQFHSRYTEQAGIRPSPLGFSKNNILSYYAASNPNFIYKNTYTYDGERIATWSYREYLEDGYVDWTQYYTYE